MSRSARWVRLTLLTQVLLAWPVLLGTGFYPIYYGGLAVDTLDLVALALGISMLPGLSLWLLEELLGESPRLHELGVYLLLVLSLRLVLSWGQVELEVAIALALVLAIPFLRIARELPSSPKGVRLGILFSLAPPVYFLGFSPTAALVQVRTPKAAPKLSPNPEPKTTLVLVFDALPLSILVNSKREIPAIYPNLRRLHRTSTLFTNAIANHLSTYRSLPSLLTGTPPDARPQTGRFFRDYPENLLRQVAAQRRTHILSPSLDFVPSSEVSGRAYQPSRLAKLRSFLRDLWLFAPHLYALEGVGIPWNEVSFYLACNGQDARDVWLPPGKVDRSRLFLDWLEDFGPEDRGSFSYLYLYLPHAPFQHLPSGEPVALNGRDLGMQVQFAEDGRITYQWTEDEWTVRQSYQRLLFQMQTCDRLLGKLLDKLEALGMLAETQILLTGDHGSALGTKKPPRNLVLPEGAKSFPPMAAEVLPVPIFLKAPGVPQAGVDDSPRQLLDVYPTLLELLGEAPPEGQTPGNSLLRPLPPGAKTRVFTDFANRGFPVPQALSSKFDFFDSRRAWFHSGPESALAKGWIYRLNPFGALVGAPRESLKILPQAPPWISQSQESTRQPPGVLAGEVRGEGLPPALFLALVQGQKVVATTRTQRLSPNRHSFLAFYDPQGEPLSDGDRTKLEVLVSRQSGEWVALKALPPLE